MGVSGVSDVSFPTPADASEPTGSALARPISRVAEIAPLIDQGGVIASAGEAANDHTFSHGRRDVFPGSGFVEE
ncbi:MAG: hypothetical protein EON58_11560 [Alphaproteobacteria bacterium]|nr:MAG: hypothetical protein EON58_11560 [Alphaproteobacteria bacterium]